MNDYSQPAFYRFNQDSLSLVDHVLKQNLAPQAILDMGAGCGVIGLELARNLKPISLTLLELQQDFEPFLKINTEEFLPNVHTTITISSFGAWRSEEHFDLIVCNPPYYLPGRGEASADPNRGQCRSFLKDGWVVLLTLIDTHLAPQGKAFLVIKDDKAVMNEIEQKIKETKLNLCKLEKEDLLFLVLSHRD